MHTSSLRDLRRLQMDHGTARVQAFTTFHKAGSAELDPTARFVRALLASAGPIRQPGLVGQWHGHVSREDAP